LAESSSGKRWLVKASRDLRAASALLSLKPALLDMAGFHCQQAVEKCLKFHLANQGQKTRKIHDLRALYDSALEVGWSHVVKASVLDQISYCAVIVRYPEADDGRLTKRDVTNWLKIAKRAFEYASEHNKA
jgi:HEPN domain-containing protein